MKVCETQFLRSGLGLSGLLHLCHSSSSIDSNSYITARPNKSILSFRQNLDPKSRKKRELKRTSSVEVTILDDALCEMSKFLRYPKARREEGCREKGIASSVREWGKMKRNEISLIPVKRGQVIGCQKVEEGKRRRKRERTHLSEVFFPMFVENKLGAKQTTRIPVDHH